MTPEIVKGFAREFINTPSARTNERKQIIATVYKSLTGERPNSTCETCLIEAIFKILSLMGKKPCSYRLQKGALLRTIGDESKTCTNDNLTDDLAEFHLRTNPGSRKYFTVIPASFDPDPEATQKQREAEEAQAATEAAEAAAEAARIAEEERVKAEEETKRLAEEEAEKEAKEKARIEYEAKLEKEREAAALARKEEAAKKAAVKKPETEKKESTGKAAGAQK